MKELSIEEKAKHYDEALETARKINSGEGVAAPPDWSVCEVIFPELKESEDEKVRKALLDLFKIENFNGYVTLNGIDVEEVITWLEKQGEKDRFIKEEIECIKGYRENAIKKLGELENQNEQKETLCDKCKKEQPSHSCQDITASGRCYIDDMNTANKVEPKFHKGDWVVCEITGSVYQIKECIENLSNYKYGYEITDGGYISSDEVNHYHLWTIADVKDGDVLSFDNECSNYHSIEIFKRIASKNELNGNTYRCYVKYGGFKEKLEIPINGDELHHCGTSAHPATKEQCELLFQKMHEAGYEWDANKKELKEIKKTSKWSEEDERHENTIIRAIHGAGNITPIDGELAEKWLKSLKQRMEEQL